MSESKMRRWKIKLLRAWCAAFHWREQVRHNGFGWHGWRCRRCGWMFFADWDEDFKRARAKEMT
jgi:hypothetical protein